MKKIFPSKVDIALPILFVVTSIPAIVVGVRDKDLMVFVIMIATFGFMMYLLYDTNYTITEGNLKVHSGFIVNKNIPISEIKCIRKTDSLLSAPASSLTERIEVLYESKKSIIISPKDRKEFIEELLKQNSEIEVEV
ncbi:PH domain-containing protein [Flavobacterium haoranii]|uniref:PH domain-containing protein n=1 Tax=Flavobacterium haoranii TaxID=683124 RepID=A0A1M6G310_9FLAO|nr:PH domain-containing protein [Flavobacterium haoranii]SHJ04310.1 PH domain-containing protein [Flavobacterium haoranii]